MCKEDIAQVTEIDREAFPTLWPPANYRNELSNPLAHYIVACDGEKRVELPGEEAASEKNYPGLISGVRRLFSYARLVGNEPLPSTREYVVGFAGFWVMADEAHIISIAVRKEYYRQGIGERLLIALIELAMELGVRIITLEVRASNTAAQSLYSKYGFAQVGIRRGYYSDNREDGVLMSTEDINSSRFQARFKQLRQAHSEKWQVALNQVAQ